MSEKNQEIPIFEGQIPKHIIKAIEREDNEAEKSGKKRRELTVKLEKKGITGIKRQEQLTPIM